MSDEDQDRIREASDLINQAAEQASRQGLPFGPSEVSPLGFEYYQLIAAIEKMSAHDIYTLFMSP